MGAMIPRSGSDRRVGLVTTFHFYATFAFWVVIVLNGRSAVGFGTPPAMDQLEFELRRPIRIETLLEILADRPHRLRFLAVCAAGELGPDAKAVIPQLIAALDDEDWIIRSNAAHALGQMGASAATAVPSLIKSLADEKKNVCCHAAVALGAIGSAAEAAIPALIVRVSDTDEADDQGDAAACNAAEALGKFCRTAKDALPVLVANLNDDGRSHFARRYVASALGRIARAGDLPAVAALRRAACLDAGIVEGEATNEEAGTRIAAALALWKVSHEPQVIPWLMAAVKDGTLRGYIREQSLKAIGEIGPDASAAVAILISLATDKSKGRAGDSYLTLAAIEALGKIGVNAKGAVPMLLTLHDNDGRVSQAAAEALGEIGPAANSAIPALVEALSARDDRTRVSAAVAIRKIGGDVICTIPVLDNALAVSEIWCYWSKFAGLRLGADLRRRAADALGELGPVAKAGVPGLKAALKDDFVTVRDAAQDALRRIEGSPEAP